MIEKKKKIRQLKTPDKPVREIHPALPEYPANSIFLLSISGRICPNPMGTDQVAQ
jgi:hypothetical protein